MDLSNSEVDTVRVSLSDVLEVGSTDIMSGSTSVTITGDAMDTVELSTEGGDWSLSGTAVEGEDTYMIYENDQAKLLINEKIQLIIS